MSRPTREAKRRAIEIIVGHQTDDDDLINVQSEASEDDGEENYQDQDNEEIIDVIPEDDALEDEVIFWPEDDSDDDDEFRDLPVFPQPEEMSPDGRAWRKGLPGNAAGRQPRHNIFTGSPGAIKRGIHPESEMEAFLIFADDIIEKSVIFTNLQGRRSVSKSDGLNVGKKNWRKTDKEEMHAFYGLLLLAGAYKAQYRSTEELWSEREGHPVFRATMSRHRFCELKSNLRFDDPLRRDRDDPMAPVREITTTFISSLKEYVFAPEYLCIDEQLLEFHGRVKFRQYIPSKPGKFGIKIFWLTDSLGTYCFNGLIYIGAATMATSERNQSASLAEALVMNLMKPFLNNGRHLTADNWFSSVSLTERLLASNTTYVGTIRKNQRGLPPSLKSTVGRHQGDTSFAHNDKIILVSFWDKGNSPVILIDSLHRGNETVENKPSTVQFYNQTKSGVDILDKKIRSFSCKRKCRRWPVSVISNLVDIACINAMYILKKPDAPVQKTGHYEFLKNVGYQLVDQHIRKRILKKSIKTSVRVSMEMIGYKLNKDHRSTIIPLEKSRRCQLCPYSKDHKTKNLCSKCLRAMCGSHRAFVCIECSVK